MADEGAKLVNSIIAGTVVAVAFGVVALTGAHYFLTPASIPKPQPQECQTIRVGESEELGDVVRRMRIYDSGITVDKLAEQNNLYEGEKLLNIVAGTELMYCYNK